MSTKIKITLSPVEWVSPAEAARIRGVSRQAIAKLLRSGRIATVAIAGKTLVKLADVKSFQPMPPGRKRREKKP